MEADANQPVEPAQQPPPLTNYQPIIDANNRAVKKIIAEDKQYAQAQRMLLELQELLKRTQYADVRTEHQHQAVLNYNLACIYQKLWKNQQCCSHLQRSIDFQELEIGQCSTDVERMARRIDLIRCFLQYCAVLSQLNRHDRALEVSKCIIRSEKDIFQRCRRLCEERLNQHRSNAQGNSNLVRFEAVLIEEAYEKLRYLAEIPDADAVLHTSQSTFKAISESIYYWKNIPQNNEKLMRKELRLSSPTAAVRSVLGVCKNDEWVDSFNIGSVMMMKPKLLEQRQRAELLHIISSKSLLQQIFYTSIGYFTIATEIRFKEVETDVKGLKQNEKFMRLSKNEFVNVCKVYHLKAIELAGRYVSTSSQYINHLILSFNKNYKSSMDPINEESFIVNESVMMGAIEKDKAAAVDSIHEVPFHHPPPIHHKELSNFARRHTLEKTDDLVLPRYQSRHEQERETPIEHHNHSSQAPTVREARSQTKESNEKTNPTTITKRPNRIKSEQTYKKCHEIKTFTFKFVKEVKESSLPKKKQKMRSVSRGRKQRK